MQQQIKSIGWLYAWTILSLGFEQSDFLNMLARNPVRVSKAECCVPLNDMEPVKRQVEPNNSVFTKPFDQPKRFANRTPPDFVKNNRAIFLGILEEHHLRMQTARFGIEINLTHSDAGRGVNTL